MIGDGHEWLLLHNMQATVRNAYKTSKRRERVVGLWKRNDKRPVLRDGQTQNVHLGVIQADMRVRGCVASKSWYVGEPRCHVPVQ